MAEFSIETALTPEDTQRLFNRRTTSHFEDTVVTEEQRRAIYDLMKMGPTAFNSQPLRVVWVARGEARDRLVSHMAPANQQKTADAPLVALLAVDTTWHHKFDRFLPARPQVGQMFLDDEALAENTGRNNGFIQVGYFIMAVRAMGLDAGPMTGFDNAGMDADLLEGTGLQSIVVATIGQGQEPAYDRSPRYSFEDSTTTL